MSLDRLVRPTFAEARSTALQEGFLFGLIPGIITDVSDPEKIGRVRVECPVVERNVNLPNGDDGWIPVIEPFVVNSSTGGVHSFLQVGSQVVMACLFGDPRQFVVVGCLPSRVDRPHPDLNRSEGTYGFATPNETIEAYRDEDGSAVISRPNGVLQTITGQGDFMVQTEDRGRLQLQQNGEVRVENDLSHVRVSPTGEVSQQSRDGAIAILRDTGEIDLQSAQLSRVRLNGAEGVLEGPLDDLSQTIRQVRSSLSGTLGQIQGILTDLGAIADSFDQNNPLDFLEDIGGVLGKLQGAVGGNLGRGLGALTRMGEFSVGRLGQSLLPQVGAMSGLSGLIPSVLPLLVPQASGLAIAQQVFSLLSGSQQQGFRIPMIGNILEGLRHSPDQQLQAILGAIAPGGFGAIQNIVGLNLHTVLGDIQGVIGSFQKGIGALPDLFQRLLGSTVGQISRLLPEAIRGFVPTDALRSIVQLGSVKDSVQSLLGNVIGGLARQTLGRVTGIQGLLSAVGPIAGLVGAIKTGGGIGAALGLLKGIKLPFGLGNLFGGGDDDDDAPPLEQLQSITSIFSRTAIPLISSALSSVNQLINAVPDGTTGSRVRTTQTFAQIETHLGTGGAIARVSETTAALRSPDGLNQVFAGLGGAGVRTPFGRFSFGGLGGGLIAKGAIALRALQDDGDTVGMLLDPRGGISLSSFRGQGGYREDDDSVVWRDENARINVQDGTVLIEVLADRNEGAQPLHQIRVSREGIFLNDVSVTWLSTLESRFNGLVSRITALEQAGGTF